MNDPLRRVQRAEADMRQSRWMATTLRGRIVLRVEEITEEMVKLETLLLEGAIKPMKNALPGNGGLPNDALITQMEVVVEAVREQNRKLSNFKESINSATEYLNAKWVVFENFPYLEELSDWDRDDVVKKWKDAVSNLSCLEADLGDFKIIWNYQQIKLRMDIQKCVKRAASIVVKSDDAAAVGDQNILQD